MNPKFPRKHYQQLQDNLISFHDIFIMETDTLALAMIGAHSIDTSDYLPVHEPPRTQSPEMCEIINISVKDQTSRCGLEIGEPTWILWLLCKRKIRNTVFIALSNAFLSSRMREDDADSISSSPGRIQVGSLSRVPMISRSDGCSNNLSKNRF